MDRLDAAALVWTGLCVLGFAVAPRAPEVPAVRPDEIAVMDASAQAAAERARTWMREHGDVVLPWEEAEGHMAIVVDDVGRDLHAFEALAGLRLRLTFNVLPGAPYALGVQQRLRTDDRRPREVWLHLPMEPHRSELMEEGPEAAEAFLRLADDPKTLREKVEAALARVPLAVGVGHHMGSAFSERPDLLEHALAPICERGLAYLDSRTSPASRAEDVARRLGCVVARRDVFLDDAKDEASVARALGEAVRLARIRPVVVVAHPLPATIRVLRRAERTLAEEGIGVYPLSEVISHLRAPRPTTPDGSADGPPN